MSNSGATTRRMIAVYEQQTDPQMFFSRMFRTPAENFHDTEEVELDIWRTGEDVATVITDLSTGGNVNSLDRYTNKSFRPPIYDEVGTVNAFDLIKRYPGEDPFQNPNFQANATRLAMRQVRKLDNKVRRAVELQAAQVLQNGQLTLNDKSGNAVYNLNFQPKATHFPTVSTAWSSGSSDKLGDINSLANVIRTNGLGKPDMLVFGETAFSQFINDENVRNLLDNRRIGIGEVMPADRGEGAVFQGFIWINNYRYEMWTYEGRYIDPNTGASTKYLADDKVIVRDSQGRLDLTFGSIPLIGTGRPPALPALPQRMVSTTGGFGMTTNSWVAEDGKSLYVSAGSRPLCIPTAIDKFGALDTNP